MCTWVSWFISGSGVEQLYFSSPAVSIFNQLYVIKCQLFICPPQRLNCRAENKNIRDCVIFPSAAIQENWRMQETEIIRTSYICFCLFLYTLEFETDTPKENIMMELESAEQIRPVGLFIEHLKLSWFRVRSNRKAGIEAGKVLLSQACLVPF